MLKILLKTSLLILLFVSFTQADEFSKSEINKVLKETYNKFKGDVGGKNADYIKALAQVDPKTFGITLVDAKGNIYEIGQTNQKVSIQSISKVFTAALLMSEKGDKFIRDKVGVNATGLAFNSIIAIEQHNGSALNPFVNAGAIQSTSWINAKDSDQRWQKILANMNAFAGRDLKLNQEVYKSEVNDNKRNQAISKLLDAYGRMGSDPLEATTVYTKQCSVNVSSHDLAVMAATIANHGTNPVTKALVLNPKYTPKLMSIMITAGLYDNAGEWLFDTGLPAKSGVGGGIIAVVPGKFGIAVVSPPLDKYGNSVRAQLAIKYLVEKLKLNPLGK
jgi:glutaminase